MLQDIRSNFLKGPWAKGIAMVIALSFALFGVQSILVGGSDDSIAIVNGEKISESELRNAINSRMQRLVAVLGEDFDIAELDQERLKTEALNFIISEEILMQLISDLNLMVGESELGAEIASMEPFKEGGTFSAELYKSTIMNAGYTPARFKADAKTDILKRHLYTGVIGSDFTTPLELELEGRISTEKRDVRYVKIPISYFSRDVVVTENEIENYYLKNSASYSTEEKVSVEYIEVKSEQFINPVDKETLINEYNSVKLDYMQPEENRVSHVLFIKKSEESQEEYENRIASAEEKLSEGSDFAEVAQRFSDDLGSAQLGGDLGFSSGDAFPEEMEVVASKLSVGELSDRVKTEAGTHLLLLTERKEKIESSFEELREQLEREVELRSASAHLMSLAEELRDVVFNSSDLSEAAEITGSKIEFSDLFSRSGKKDGVFSNQKVLNASFSEEVLKEGYNSEMIELSPEHFIVLRKSRYLPAALKPLEEVESQIILQIKDSNTRLVALEETDRLGDAIINGETTIEQIALDNGYEWQVEIGSTRTDNMLPKEISQQVFSISSAERIPVADKVFSDSGFIFLFELVRVQAGGLKKFSQQELPKVKKQLAQAWGEAAYSELQQVRRDAAEIEVF